MKQSLLLIVLGAQLIGCTNRPRQNEHADSIARTDSARVIFSDQTQSQMQVYGDSANGWVYKSSEAGYKVMSFAGNPFGDIFKDVSFGKDIEYFIIKFVATTTARQGSETEEKNISAEIRPMRSAGHVPLTIRQNCDDLLIKPDYYKTVKYGCCGGDDQFAIYDFQNNLIIQGDEKIISGSIPNLPIKFFVAYKPDDRDTSFVGTLFFSFNSITKYQVRIKPCPALPLKCEYRVPDIIIYSPDKRDNFVKEDNEYLFWSMEKISSKDEIGNIILKVVFECTTEHKTDTIEIPIINGKPFGKNEMVQNYTCK